MHTGPGYQTSCWQLHSLQPVPGDLGRQPVPTHKSLCSVENAAHSSSGPFHPTTPGCLPICFIAGLCQDNQATITITTNKQNTGHKKRKGRERKTTKSLLPPLPFQLWGEKSSLPQNSHGVFILTAFTTQYTRLTCLFFFFSI